MKWCIGFVILYSSILKSAFHTTFTGEGQKAMAITRGGLYQTKDDLAGDVKYTENISNMLFEFSRFTIRVPPAIDSGETKMRTASWEKVDK